jgi:hypothetical protein
MIQILNYIRYATARSYLPVKPHSLKGSLFSESSFYRSLSIGHSRLSMSDVTCLIVTGLGLTLLNRALPAPLRSLREERSIKELVTSRLGTAEGPGRGYKRCLQRRISVVLLLSSSYLVSRRQATLLI